MTEEVSTWWIKKIGLDNTSAFTSHVFHEYSNNTFHTQNGLVESLIKCIKKVARSLLMRANFPMATWGYAILHTTILICIKPISYNKYSIMQLAFGQ